MSYTDLRKKIVSHLEKTNDEDLLKAIYEILELHENSEKPYVLSQKELEKVKLAQRQIAHRKTFTQKKLTN